MTLALTEMGRLPRCAIPTHYDLELELDLERRVFSGAVAITLDVVDATDTLTLNVAELEIHSARLEHFEGRSLAGEAVLVPAKQQVELVFPEPLSPRRGYRLILNYSGAFEGQLRGLYGCAFSDESGEEHVIVTTQFEPSDARRAFPCWDEPDFKATFKVRLVVASGLTALSNGPEESSEELGDGRRRIAFAETMPMSTYLVAFVVGPYALTGPADADGVLVRIAAVPGKEHLAGYAAEVAVHALRFLGRYFDIPYPGSKIDHVAVPDFAFGAMENFGCVVYRENALLADPQTASHAELQRIATVVAHETAHMWFGDLVTMKWWNGLWLNEAFATFMENATVDAYERDWDVWASFGAGRAAALTTDGLHSARAVELDVERPEDAEAMFDVLTYQKGGAVLRMLEQFLGAETFRTGISHYLRSHSYANTETTDLWDALEQVSGIPVRAIMEAWIFNPGHPLVTVDLDADQATIDLRQQRFHYDSKPIGSEVWAVPVTIRASAGGAVQQHRLLLDTPRAQLSFDATVDWAVVNDGAHGFYRVRYSPGLWQRLKAAAAIEILSPGERLAILADTWAEVVSGRAGLSEWAGVVAWFEDHDPDVWASVATALTHLAVIAGEQERYAVDGYIERIVDPVWTKLGWDPPAGESRRRMSARARVLAAAALIEGESRLKQEARTRFSEFVEDGGTLAPDLVGPAARIYVATGGEPSWATVLNLYRRATVPQDRHRYLHALGETGDPALLARTLDMTLTSEVRAQDAPAVVAAAMAHPGNARAGWEWVKANWAAVSTRYPNTLLVRALDAIVYVVDPAFAADVKRFSRGADIPSAGPRLDQLLERMDINVRLAARLRGTLREALAPEA
jgi:puromycin-sensitive aminopeptidase